MNITKFKVWHNKENKMYYPSGPYDSSVGPFGLLLDILLDGRIYTNGIIQDVQLLQFIDFDSLLQEMYEEDLIYYEHHYLPDKVIKHFGTLRYSTSRFAFIFVDMFAEDEYGWPLVLGLDTIYQLRDFGTIKNIQVIGSTFEYGPQHKAKYDELKGDYDILSQRRRFPRRND